MTERRDTHGCCGVPERVFRDDLVLGFAQNEADTWLIIAMTEQVVDSGEIEIHLAGVFRFERRHLKVDDYKASELQVIEQQVELEVLASDFERYLAADESETYAELDQELAQVHEQSPFEVAFLCLVGEG